MHHSRREEAAEDEDCLAMGKFTDPTVCRVRNVPRGDTDGYVYIYTRSIRGHARGKREKEEEEEEERDWRRNKKEKERKKKKGKEKKKEGIRETRTHSYTVNTAMTWKQKKACVTSERYVPLGCWMSML